jgi:hypothetical protein
VFPVSTVTELFCLRLSGAENTDSLLPQQTIKTAALNKNPRFAGLMMASPLIQQRLMHQWMKVDKRVTRDWFYKPKKLIYRQSESKERRIIYINKPHVLSVGCIGILR